jgi:hypothetical protein
MPRVYAGTFEEQRAEVEAMLACGESFDLVERTLEAAPLPDDERAAIWLMAWALSDSAGPNEPVELKLVKS